MMPVDSWFRTSFWAVPALSLVLPVTNSGPVSNTRACSAASTTVEAGFEVMATVMMPCPLAHSNAPFT